MNILSNEYIRIELLHRIFPWNQFHQQIIQITLIFFSEFDDPDSGLVSLTGFPPTEERSRPDGAEEDEPDQRYVIFVVRLCLD